MITLSAVIITHNEERNIERCLKSLQGVADEIVVVDSGSTDGTADVCQRCGVRPITHEWEGYAQQKNYANRLATGDWLLSLDADEALSDELRSSLVALKQADMDGGTAYEVARLTNFCGHWVRHCGWYPDARVRMWQRGKAQWEGSVHEQLRFASPVRTFRLKGDLLHYSYYSLSELSERQPKYYQLAAQEAYAQGHRVGAAALMLKPAWSFVRDYFLRGGLLDGVTGYVVCRMNAHYTFMKYATLKEMSNKVVNV
ncbi:MAG: glycosyltransferase family 2 protein [Bacteroidales bacterium]|nr:glycosyltransferase family 2 protein [Bacteroidales bacterium]